MRTNGMHYNPIQSNARPIRTLQQNEQKLTVAADRFYSSTRRQYKQQTKLVINAVGTDRLGIVQDMTKEVIDAGGNVGASQAAKLGKYFSLMMLVEVPESAVQALEERLETLEDLSTSICVAKDDDGAVASTETIGYKGALSLEGADHPGIVHKVTKILSSHGLNIDSLETTDELAPQGGTVLFRMIGITHAYEPLSAGFDVEKIKQELSELGDALNCDILLIDLDDDDVF